MIIGSTGRTKRNSTTVVMGDQVVVSNLEDNSVTHLIPIKLEAMSSFSILSFKQSVMDGGNDSSSLYKEVWNL